MQISNIRFQRICYMPPSSTDISLSLISEQCIVKHAVRDLREPEEYQEMTLDMQHPQVNSILECIHQLNIPLIELQGDCVLDGEKVTLTFESGDSTVCFSWMNGNQTQAWQPLVEVCDMVENLIKETGS